MNKMGLILLSTLALSYGCQDRVSDGSVNTNQSTTPVIADKCDNSISFEGLMSIGSITDSSALISWASDTESLGYTVFKDNGSGLEIIQNVSANENSLLLKNLSPETNYRLLVRTVGIKGNYDCNENSKDLDTPAKTVFASCKEINDFYSGTQPSGDYEIDLDLSGPKQPITVECDMDNNQGGWTKVFSHSTAQGLFADDTEALETNVNDHTSSKYSILSKLEELRRDGKLEFWLHYPELDGIDGGNIWTQTSNPTVDKISGYLPIKIDNTGFAWGGLEKNDRSETFIDGSVSSSWWFYAIGSQRNWGGASTIPGPASSGISEVTLYVR
jgi:hypothetical protein